MGSSSVRAPWARDTTSLSGVPCAVPNCSRLPHEGGKVNPQASPPAVLVSSRKKPDVDFVLIQSPAKSASHHSRSSKLVQEAALGNSPFSVRLSDAFT